MSQFFTSHGQSIGASASTSVLPVSIQGWFPLRFTAWISLQSKGLSVVFSNTTVQKRQFFDIQPSLWSDSHIHTWLVEKTTALTRWIFVRKVMSLLLNTLSRFIITFLPRSKRVLSSWLQSPSAVILEPKKIKSVTVSIVSSSIAMKWWDRTPWSIFWTLSFKPTFSLFYFTFIKRLFSSSSLSAIRVMSSV